MVQAGTSSPRQTRPGGTRQTRQQDRGRCVRPRFFRFGVWHSHPSNVLRVRVQRNPTPASNVRIKEGHRRPPPTPSNPFSRSFQSFLTTNRPGGSQNKVRMGARRLQPNQQTTTKINGHTWIALGRAVVALTSNNSSMRPQEQPASHGKAFPQRLFVFCQTFFLFNPLATSFSFVFLFLFLRFSFPSLFLSSLPKSLGDGRPQNVQFRATPAPPRTASRRRRQQTKAWVVVATVRPSVPPTPAPPAAAAQSSAARSAGAP